MDVCTLPVTGMAGSLWIAVVVLAGIAAVAAGGLLRARAGASRGVASGIAALAVVGALTLGSVAGAPGAQADAGRDCVVASQRGQQAPSGAATAPSSPASTSPTVPPSVPPTVPPSEQPPIAVVPEAPTSADRCGLEPAIAIPTQEGVAYAEQQDGSTLTVTATATAGYVLAESTQTTWTFDTTPTTSTPFPFALPAETTAFASFTVLPDPNATYGMLDRTLVPSLLEAAEPGVLDVAFAASATTMPVDFAVLQGGAFQRVVTVEVPVAFELAYDVERGLLVLTDAVPGSTEAAVAAARAEVQAANPDAVLVRSFASAPDLDLSIDVAYVPGPGWAPETSSIGIDAIVPD